MSPYRTRIFRNVLPEARLKVTSWLSISLKCVKFDFTKLSSPISEHVGNLIVISMGYLLILLLKLTLSGHITLRILLVYWCGPRPTPCRWLRAYWRWYTKYWILIRTSIKDSPDFINHPNRKRMVSFHLLTRTLSLIDWTLLFRDALYLPRNPSYFTRPVPLFVRYLRWFPGLLIQLQLLLSVRMLASRAWSFPVVLI